MRISATFVKFVLAGGIAAAVNIAARIGFSHFMSYEWAVVAAYLCGMVVAFCINRSLVFTHAQGADAAGQGMRFALVNLVALGQVWLVGVGLVRIVFPYFGMNWHAETVAHVIAVASPVVTSYFAHKHFSFRHA